MNSAAFVLISILTLGAALAAATLRKLMHAALCFALTFGGLAMFFLLLGAEFVGLALVFIYVGAVAVLIVFTILLTRRDAVKERRVHWAGAVIAVVAFGTLAWSILRTESVSVVAHRMPSLTVGRIGEALMTGYVWPLQCTGLLLTAALIGALVLVMEEKQ